MTNITDAPHMTRCTLCERPYLYSKSCLGLPELMIWPLSGSKTHCGDCDQFLANIVYPNS